MFFIGVDPDTVRPAFAFLSEEGEVKHLFCPKIPNKENYKMMEQFSESASDVDGSILDGKGRACIESQYIGSNSTANSTMHLARNCGACQVLLTIFGVAVDDFELISQKLIAPVKWKGSIPKDIHQARVLKKLGWGYVKKGGKSPYCIPKNPPDQFKHLKAGEWKHLVDAIGMAMWAKEVYEKEKRTGMKIWDKL